MASEKSSIDVKMADGETIKTRVIVTGADLEAQLNEFWSIVRKNPPFVVGFDTEWMCTTTGISNRLRPVIAMLKLCTLGKDDNDNNNKSCLLINLNALHFTMVRPLLEFLSIKDIKFVGINISKDVEKLKEDHGLEVRNAVELMGSISANRRLGGGSQIGALWCTDREELPNKLLLEQPSYGYWGISVTLNQINYERLQYAVSSVYNAVKLAQKLLLDESAAEEGPVHDAGWIIT